MFRGPVLLAVVLLLTTAAPAQVGAQGNDLIFKVTYVTGGTFEQTAAIVKLKIDAGKAAGELVAGSPRLKKVVLKSAVLEGKTLRIVLQGGNAEMVFETTVSNDIGKRLPGVMSINGTLYPAWMEATKDTAIDLQASLRPIDCPPLQEARTLSSKPLSLRLQAQKTKDAEKKKDLQKKAAEADAVAKKETPRLYREVLAKHADSPAVFDAALSLIRTAQSNDAKADDVKGWATTAIDAGKVYGPRWQTEYTAQVAVALLAQDNFSALAVDYARKADRTLLPQSSAADQMRVVTLLTKALRKTGKEDEAKTFDGRIAKLDAILDREYLATMPPFKGETFAGRKAKSDRVVFMELFTGAMCPPCVAADLAFDGLQKTYKPSELVLIQYHMHIPGPDPLTNPDTEARWKFYGSALRGVPASLFNGKPAASGGGGIANAEDKYNAYREVIDPLLEEPGAVRLSASAQRKGDTIDINVRVTRLTEPGSNKKLRILLAEESIGYAGSNKIRFHHNVVRAFPGGVAGLELNDANSTHQASINLGQLRGGLTKYLDDFQTKNPTRPFSNPARPMAMEHLRVIAFVQDDSTKEILQAVQVEVK
jgi:hypothetical protein